MKKHEFTLLLNLFFGAIFYFTSRNIDLLFKNSKHLDLSSYSILTLINFFFFVISFIYCLGIIIHFIKVGIKWKSQKQEKNVSS